MRKQRCQRKASQEFPQFFSGAGGELRTLELQAVMRKKVPYGRILQDTKKRAPQKVAPFFAKRSASLFHTTYRRLR